jgi:hypothetical protein
VWNYTNAARTEEPAPPEPAPLTSVPPRAPESPDTIAARTCGWFALGIGAFAWFIGKEPLPRRIGYEIQHLYWFVTFGVFAAIGVGLGIRAVRLDRRLVVAWLSLAANVSFVVLVILHLVRRLWV